MKKMTSNVFFNKIKHEYIFKSSNFMDKVILLDSSIYRYCKEYHKINIFYHPFKFFYYLKLRNIVKNKECQNYINSYKFKNEGWISSSFIPKNKHNRRIEIFNAVGKQQIVTLRGYGYSLEGKNDCVFGWICWVQRWRFIDNIDSNEIEEIQYYKKRNKNE